MLSTQCEMASTCVQTPYMGMSEEQIIQRKVHEAVDMEAPPCAPAAVAELIQKCLDRQRLPAPHLPGHQEQPACPAGDLLVGRVTPASLTVQGKLLTAF